MCLHYPKKSFLRINDKQYKLVIFSGDPNFRTFCKSKCIYVCGTFSSKFFKQMFTIRAHINGQVITYNFVCLFNTQKTTLFYYFMILTREKYRDVYCDFKPTVVISDFVKAIYHVCDLIWPNV